MNVKPNSSTSHRPSLWAVLLLLCLPWLAPSLLPLARSAETKPKAPPLQVMVDPRVELMSIIFRLAGNSEYNQGRVESYINDVEKHFGEFRDHPVVELAGKLRRTRGVSYDAVMKMAVHVDDAVKLGEKVPFDPRPDGLDRRWRLHEAREFLELARQFVEETAFEDFIKNHEPLYETTRSRMQAMLDKEAHLEWFSEFFGERPDASFTVAPALVNGGCCYGSHLNAADGKEELYCILGVWKTDAKGLPTFDRSMVDTVVHEFCHSYTNAVVVRHRADLQPAGEKIFPYVAGAMQRQAYGNWETMMRESFVRACCVRYARRHGGPIAAWRAVQYEKSRSFFWVGELAGLLEEYETQRDKYPTLDAFTPKIVTFFNEYAEKFAKEQAALAKKRPKIVSMTPANGATDVDPKLAAIKVLFDRPMQDRSWAMVGAGPHHVPEKAGDSSYDAAGTTWTAPVKLKPNWSYQFMLNSDGFTGFRSRDGVPLAPVTVEFKTR